MRFRQHIPSYFSGFDPEIITTNSLKKIINSEIVSRWKNFDGFVEYAISIDEEFDQIHLLVITESKERKNYINWSVIGIIKNFTKRNITDLKKRFKLLEDVDLYKSSLVIDKLNEVEADLETLNTRIIRLIEEKKKLKRELNELI